MQQHKDDDDDDDDNNSLYKENISYLHPKATPTGKLIDSFKSTPLSFSFCKYNIHISAIYGAKTVHYRV